MNNFTLIIPTHNRHNYLKRSIAYFENSAASIIYCDSSETVYEGRLGNNMKYLHLPLTIFSKKILYALNLIETDYVALCADDDFIMLDALSQGINFLNQNKAFATVLGLNIAFHEKFDGEYYFEGNSSLPDEINFDPKKNTQIFFNNYRQVLWGMYNKNIVEKAFNIIQEAKFKNENYIELVLGGVACYCGGIKILESVWSVRELSAKEHWGDKHNAITFDYFESDSRNDFKQFKIKVDKITYDGFSEFIMESYLKLTFISKCKLLIKSFLKNIIPPILIRIIKHNPNKEKYNNSIEKYNTLKKFNASTDIEYSLNKISNIIKEFSEQAY